MSVVKINAITVPPEAHEELERRFAHRAHTIDESAGFLGFQLLRPVKGEDRYFVITRWDSRKNYQKWSDARDTGAHAGDERRGMSVDVFGFDVVD